MSVQRLSALFLLRKFCSFANLNFKCLAWHVCLKLLFDKNRYYESVCVEFFHCNCLSGFGKFFWRTS